MHYGLVDKYLFDKIYKYEIGKEIKNCKLIQMESESIDDIIEHTLLTNKKVFENGVQKIKSGYFDGKNYGMIQYLKDAVSALPPKYIISYEKSNGSIKIIDKIDFLDEKLIESINDKLYNKYMVLA